MYADDLVVFPPQVVLGFNSCLIYVLIMGLDMMCNTIQKKSVAMICRTKEHRDLNFPDLYLSGQVLNVCTTAKYLGHIIDNEMSDDDDMYRQLSKVICSSKYVDDKMLYVFRSSKDKPF